MCARCVTTSCRFSAISFALIKQMSSSSRAVEHWQRLCRTQFYATACCGSMLCRCRTLVDTIKPGRQTHAHIHTEIYQFTILCCIINTTSVILVTPQHAMVSSLQSSRCGSALTGALFPRRHQHKNLERQPRWKCERWQRIVKHRTSSGWATTRTTKAKFVTTHCVKCAREKVYAANGGVLVGLYSIQWET